VLFVVLEGGTLSRALFHFSINLIHSTVFSIIGLTMEARFSPSPVCMEFVLSKVVLEQVFLLVLHFSPVIVIPSVFHIFHLSATNAMIVAN